MNPMEQIANAPRREEGLPASLPPETAVETTAAQAVTVIPAASRAALTFPPVLAGSMTPEIRNRVEHFYSSIYEIFERWVNRPKSVHTRRSYRDGVLSFVRHRGIVWPQEAHALLTISVADVQTYRDVLAAVGAAPKTINHRVSALSSFLQVSGSVGGRAAPADPGPQPSPFAIHRARVLRSARRNAVVAGGACPAPAERVSGRFDIGPMPRYVFAINTSPASH
jgi:hypothetical protein